MAYCAATHADLPILWKFRTLCDSRDSTRIKTVNRQSVL